MRLFFTCFIVLLLLRTPAAFAWDDGGHMLVAQLAYERLNPEVRQQAVELITQLSNPEVPNQKYTFVTAACWMDDVRRVEGKEQMRSWHFIDRDCAGHDPEPPHALSALRECEATLRDKNVATIARVEALACILHLVGDIHQPLHAIERDRGGNDYPITGIPELWLGIAENGEPVTDANPAKYQRLHAFWDVAYRYDVPPAANPEIKLLYNLGRSALPNEKLVLAVAKELPRFLPADETVVNEADASKWVAESNALACNFAFNTPRKAQPSHEYVKRAHEEANRRLALAGYRLAALLNRVLLPAEAATKD